MNETIPVPTKPTLIQTTKPSRYQRYRLIKDDLAGKSVVVGGLSVIVAIVLIFFYLLMVVFPLAESATAEFQNQYTVPGLEYGKTLHMASEEQNEIAVRFTDQGHAVFFEVETGKVVSVESIQLPDDVSISSFNSGVTAEGVVIYGLSNGHAFILKQQYSVTFPDDKRLITPSITYPMGKQALLVDDKGLALDKISVRTDEEQTTIVAKTDGDRVVITYFTKEESLFDDEATIERSVSTIDTSTSEIDFILLEKEQRLLYLASVTGNLSVYNISEKSKPVLLEHLHVLEKGRKISSFEFLNAEISLLIADDQGLVNQWTLVRDDKNQLVMQKLRDFSYSDVKITDLDAEQRRKGFVAVNEQGKVGVFHTTANRQLLNLDVAGQKPVVIALSPRANAFLLQTIDDKIYFWKLHNEHPDVSLSSLWSAIWYENYPEPEYIWQSSSSSNDFEPKMSLTPLLFGTLKAAFYAMLVAVPLAIMGAIYTAYFMSPVMRGYVKPGIELMEALPTVILGFLAGLWLAPFVERNLTGIFTLLLMIPFFVALFACLWEVLPKALLHRVPAGWNALILIPVVIISSWFAFFISPFIETLFFNGDLRNWMLNVLGIGYDQRNSLVVGLAMGFAVIPTIFSITEDAIFSVPKNLTIGSLALGATPWQTMTRVVLLTASPGIFSAVMIGFGRAVGETMIVLMATGNTPVMDLSIFQGMRTLSANIAVEMPESEVDSTHYRILFLAALVLFLFTFVFNTLAEFVRQNLREKYSSL